jgi:DNA-binding MarR family transcriptional regulator
VVLHSIATSPGSNQFELGRSLGLDKTTTTVVLDRLEDAGLIVRRPAPGDRRARVAEATGEGHEVARKVRKDVIDTERQLMAGMSDTDRAELVRLLQALAFGHFADAAPVSGSCI